MMKQLRIEISQAQPLDAIENELIRIGYRPSAMTETQGFIATVPSGLYTTYVEDHWMFVAGTETTLEQLKAMPVHVDVFTKEYGANTYYVARSEGKYKGD